MRISDKKAKQFSTLDYLGSNLVKTLVGHFDQQQMLCAKLESIADSLPTLLDPASALETSQKMVSLLKHIHNFEEKNLFPLLLKHATSFEFIEETIQRLKNEHLGDEDFSEDVSAALLTYITQRNRPQAESLSWMLRGVFENIRRHVAFEREHILPLAILIERENR